VVFHHPYYRRASWRCVPRNLRKFRDDASGLGHHLQERGASSRFVDTEIAKKSSGNASGNTPTPITELTARHRHIPAIQQPSTTEN